ncbi:unnamed protein product [Vicia faba]|uniref:Protein FAR1-RELATED SEQUENCE n=1 Tax=Vicia faba TaxID=3906 RepID=A0AAV1B917_VICFA|nr:unnamed protein product [Vicia faba]
MNFFHDNFNFFNKFILFLQSPTSSSSFSNQQQLHIFYYLHSYSSFTTLFNKRTFNIIPYSRFAYKVRIDSQFAKVLSCDNDANDDVQQSSNDEDDYDNDNDEESVGMELSNNQAVVGDRLVIINSITSDEIRAMKFGNVSEAYEFYYRYGKCKGFAIRKIHVRRRGLEGNRTCHIMGYMVAQKGGYNDVGFTKKDRSEIIYESYVYAEYSVNNDGRLKSFFWAGDSSRLDYFCFGDVLSFDTTYKKNKYNYLLVIFSSCNHHS